ncbi:hypothetical protein [Mycobacterium kansasii]|nr:hypothetical protein [Mycobacterium kansasii]KEP41918.1 hypothetical protein MKSMC1_29160 [Mycobacterium kansasii]
MARLAAQQRSLAKWAQRIDGGRLPPRSVSASWLAEARLLKPLD